MQPNYSSRQMLLMLAAAALTFAAAITLLLRYPPGQYSFYPVCLIHQYFHFLCPGCGTTRALAALLHGQFIEALNLNALTTLLLPLLLLHFVFYNRHLLRTRMLIWPQISAPVAVGLMTVTIAFTILRNI